MGTLTMELSRNKNRGDVEIKAFSGEVRSLEPMALEKGDQFTIPKDFKVYKQKLRGGEAEYLMVELANGNAKPFYPSTFTKSRMIYDEDGTSTGVRAVTKGTAAEFFRKYTSVQEGMEALKGKTLKVSDIEAVNTLRYDRSGMMKAQIPTIDFVEK